MGARYETIQERCQRYGRKNCLNCEDQECFQMFMKWEENRVKAIHKAKEPPQTGLEILEQWAANKPTKQNQPCTRCSKYRKYYEMEPDGCLGSANGMSGNCIFYQEKNMG